MTITENNMTDQEALELYEAEIAPYEDNPLCEPIGFAEWLQLKGITELTYEDGFVGIKTEDKPLDVIVEVKRGFDKVHNQGYTLMFVNHYYIGNTSNDFGYLQDGDYDRFKLVRT
jgi:hypothetical protein